MDLGHDGVFADFNIDPLNEIGVNIVKYRNDLVTQVRHDFKLVSLKHIT